MRIRLAHSPDPDDAFMFYGLATGAVDPGPYRFEHILEDIQTLNERAMRGEYEVTAVSIHAYPYIAGKYALCSCGASMGDNYGPMIVARRRMSVEELRGKTIAVPGLMTSAFLAATLLLGRGRFEPRLTYFDLIVDEVCAARVDAGLVIHEGQLTYAHHGLELCVDLGQWWMGETGLPLPLGGNAIRRDLGDEACRQINRILRESIRYSLDHRAEAVDYAIRFGRGLDRGLTDRFVGMYVNDWTLDYGPRGREAIRQFIAAGIESGLISAAGEVSFIDDR